MCNRKPKKIKQGRKTMTSLNAAATSASSDDKIVKEQPPNKSTPVTTPKEETKKSKVTNRSKKETKPATESTTTHKETKKEKKTNKKSEESKEMVICENLLKDLTAHEDCWPFLNPVNTKQFPTYKKIIKKPMDFETIKNNLKAGGLVTLSNIER